jgi:hypothetical protein
LNETWIVNSLILNEKNIKALKVFYVSYKDKVKKLVGHRSNKIDVSKIIQENRQKKAVN